MTNTIEKDLHSVSSTALFHKVLHHFGDWEIETGYMNRIEKSIYFDMRTLYLRQGAPLTDDLDLLAKRLSCRSDDELIALTFLLKDKFTHCKKTHSYKQKEWDLMIKNYRYRHRNGRFLSNDSVTDNVTDSVTANVTQRNENVTPLSNAERQQKARFERKKMTDTLNQMGVQVNKNIGLTQLRKLYNDKLAVTHNAQQHSVTHNDSVTQRNEPSNERNVKNNAITNNHKPITNNHNINKPPKTPLADKYTDDVQEVFEFWLNIMDKDPVKWKLTDERKKKIIARLKDGKEVMDIRQAIYNASQDNWTVTHGKTDISYICQSDSRLSEFLLKKPQTMQTNRQTNPTANRMDELRQMATLSPTNIYIDDLPTTN